ncbi:MAG: flagellar biosynthesis protein FlgA [Clostridiaceae bacterium]|nr:flagellar biosynthesis protein FlgA [Clostridiaceae bacterium]
MDLSSVKSVSPNRHLLKKILALVFSLVVIVVSFIIITNANKAARDTVEVLRVKAGDGLPAFAPITEKDIEKYPLIKKEHTDDMVLAEDLPNVAGKMSKYFLRKNSIIYKDQIIDEKPLKNEWLYNLDKELEVLTIPYNYLECGGDVLLPGDTVRIRVSYEIDAGGYVDPAEGNPNATVVQTRGRAIRTDILFDSIVVMDMLNSNSHSIYEIYKEVTKLSEDKKQEVMKSEDFLRNIQPRALLLAGSKEQMNQYAKFKSSDAKAFLITILSRANSEVVLDQLPTLKNEVESWIEKNKKQ